MAAHASAAHSGEHKHPPYILIFYVLGILTIIEVVVAFLPWSEGLMRTVLMALAVAKAILVAQYYMHLKTEGRFLYAVALSPLLFAAILFAAVYWDIVATTYRV